MEGHVILAVKTLWRFENQQVTLSQSDLSNQGFDPLQHEY